MTHPLLALAEEFETLPDLRCPTCGFGHLTRTKKWVRREDAATADAKAQRPDDFDPDWISGVFGGFLVCAHDGCGEQVVVAGSWRVAYSLSQDGEWADMFRLTYARPALRLVEYPEGTPEPVIAAAGLAAEIVWSDPGGAANRLRLAVEELLTAQGVPRSRRKPATPGKPGRLVRRLADDRIKELGRRKPQVAEALMAVKWIGNSGSHEATLGVEDVLEGAQMLGRALRMLYDPTESNLVRRIAAVNRRSGPAPRPARTRTMQP